MGRFPQPTCPKAIAAQHQAREIGKRILQLREQRGMSRSELSRRIGVSRHAFWAIETGRNEPSFVKMCMALAAMDYSLDDLQELFAKEQESADLSADQKTLTGNIEPENFAEHLCPRCQCCDQEWVECPYCDGEGGQDGEELMSEDPMWYGPDDFRKCDACNGKGGHFECIGECDDEGKHNKIQTKERSP